MRKFGVLRCPAPVPFSGCKQDHIADGDLPLFGFRGHDAFSGGNYQNLIALMGVKLVSDSFTEIDNTISNAIRGI